MDLTARIVLTHLLGKLKLESQRTYAMIKVAAACLVLVGGVNEFLQNLSIIPTAMKALGSQLMEPWTASITVPESSSMGEDIMSWIADHSSDKNTRSLILTSGTRHSWERRSSKKALNYIPGLGDVPFRFKGHRMTFHREAKTTRLEDGKAVKLEAGSVNPLEISSLTITCFPTFTGMAVIKEFLDHVEEYCSPEQEEEETTIYLIEHLGILAGTRWDSIRRPRRGGPGYYHGRRQEGFSHC